MIIAILNTSVYMINSIYLLVSLGQNPQHIPPAAIEMYRHIMSPVKLTHIGHNYDPWTNPFSIRMIDWGRCMYCLKSCVEEECLELM